MIISDRERQTLERRLSKVDAQLEALPRHHLSPDEFNDRVFQLRKTATAILATLEASAGDC